jgi:hypothetical protein
MKKEEMIKKVNESLGSLFTKDDVINVINLLSRETPSKIDFEELTERLEAIVDEADNSDIEVNQGRCEFSITNGNEIEIEDVSYDTDSFKININHDIRQLIEATQRGEACQLEEAEEEGQTAE